LFSQQEPTVSGRLSAVFHVRPHLSAALLSRLISSVLARLLSALDDGELDDRDLVALALAVDQSAFAAEVTDGRRQSRSEHPTTSPADRTPRQSVDAAGQQKRKSSSAVSKQVI